MYSLLYITLILGFTLNSCYSNDITLILINYYNYNIILST